MKATANGFKYCLLLSSEDYIFLAIKEHIVWKLITLDIYIYTDHSLRCNTRKASQKLNVLSYMGGAPSCSLDMLGKLQKSLFRTVGSTFAASLEPWDHQCKSFL